MVNLAIVDVWSNAFYLFSVNGATPIIRPIPHAIVLDIVVFAVTAIPVRFALIGLMLSAHTVAEQFGVLAEFSHVSKPLALIAL